MHKSNIVGFQILPGPVDSRELAVAGILERDIIPLIILLISEIKRISLGIPLSLCCIFYV